MKLAEAQPGKQGEVEDFKVEFTPEDMNVTIKEVIKGTKKAWITWAVLTALTVPAYAASADGAADGSAVTMKDVVVTATRTEADVKMVPNTVEVITADDIEKLGATDVYSALRLADNVQIMNTSTGFGHRISMRGMSSDSTLILINGQRTAIEDTETTQNLLALDRINVHNIERIEIIRGAASAQYGSDALAGVILLLSSSISSRLIIHFIAPCFYYPYFSSSKIEYPTVPSGIRISKLSAIVAPITANVSVSGILPPSFISFEYASNGTYSRV